MRDRILVAVTLLPIGLYLVYLGGLYYLVLMLVILGLASWEYAGLFRAGGFKPAGYLILAGVLALGVGRYLSPEPPFAWDSWILAAVVLLAMTHHLIDYERGGAFSGTDLAITLGGVMYIGLLGSFLFSLRALPDGFWWFMVTLPAIWLADSGAYFYGRKFGKRRFSPRLSPKKSWEGFFAGVVTGPVGSALLTYGWLAIAGDVPGMTPLNSAILGFVLAVVTPLGDLGASMIKRQVGIKDSGRILPGHGGMFDRIDTWLWGGVLGYALITWFFV